MSLQTPDQFLSAVPRRGGQRNVGITTKLSDVAVNLTVLLCAKVRNSSRRDGSGTAAGPQNVGIPTIPGCRRDRFRRRRDRFTCKFIGAGPHTPFGNYNNIPAGVRLCFGGCEDFFEDVLSTYLALYPWLSSKWGLWTARLFQAFVFDMALASLTFPAFSYRFALC